MYNGERVYIYNCNNSEKIIIKNQFIDVKFLNSFRMFFYRIFFRGKGVFYVESEREVLKLEKNKQDYIQVVFNNNADTNRQYRQDLDTDSMYKLRNIYGKKILLAYEVRESTRFYFDNSLINVVDGDTIKIGDIVYRLLGIDAPETEQEYGNKATAYLRELINKAKVVSLSPADFDVYGRILAHLYIDNKPIAYSMIENKLAFQTITSFGDNGFSDISSNILERARKQGRMPFLNPETYRERVKKGETNKLTVKRQAPKKLQ